MINIDIDKDLRKDYRGQLIKHEKFHELANSIAIVCDTIRGEVPRNYDIGNRAILNLFEWMNNKTLGFVEMDIREALLDDPRLENVYVIVSNIDRDRRVLTIDIIIQRKGMREVDTVTRNITGVKGF